MLDSPVLQDSVFIATIIFSGSARWRKAIRVNWGQIEENHNLYKRLGLENVTVCRGGGWEA